MTRIFVSRVSSLYETKGAPLLQSITELDEFYEKNSRKEENKEETISLKLNIS